MDLPPPTVPPTATIEQRQQLEEITPLTEECVLVATRRYDVHPIVLSLILSVEGGWSGARVRNSDGSYDLGLAQINTIHMPELRNYGLSEAMVMNNDCINFGIAAWHLRRVAHDQTVESLDDFYRVAARYHSKTPKYNEIYSGKLSEAAEKLIQEHQRNSNGS